MRVTEPVHVRSWRARLALEYERRAGKTVLAKRSHDGPLVVQKPLYPEGEEVCHGIVVHPPAGIAGGDELDIDVRAGANAHVLLTTPGAGKWYRSGGPWARMHVSIHAQARACVEWLPQETIVFDGALADMHTEIDLTGDARYIGWEILCLGRSGSGERYTRGECRLSTCIRREGKPLWLERGRISPRGRVLGSSAGLGEHSVSGVFAATVSAERELVTACRSVTADSGEHAVTALPEVLIARYLGDSSEHARRYFEAVWRQVRPAVAQRNAVTPRIWQT
jgi:urease accessory protein